MMQKTSDPSRREFLAQSGSALGVAWLSMSLPALISSCERTWEQTSESGDSFDVLTSEEAADFGAIAAQIFPTTDTPGANEAGVVFFADAALGSFFAGSLESVRRGLAALGQKVRRSYSEGTTFSSLSNDDQIRMIEQIESEPYFGIIRFLTVVGMFSHPKYGGNRDKVGWSLLGFDDRHAWQPPFGYYDEEYANAGE